jgi:hypothetical protein
MAMRCGAVSSFAIGAAEEVKESEGRRGRIYEEERGVGVERQEERMRAAVRASAWAA